MEAWARLSQVKLRLEPKAVTERDKGLGTQVAAREELWQLETGHKRITAPKDQEPGHQPAFAII